MVRRFVKKPVIIEAVHWLGNNVTTIMAFAGDKIAINPDHTLTVHTLEGDMTGIVGDYIIKGVDGEFYPCKHDIFKKTYDEVVEQ